MQNYFQNKVVWITGASSGIGLALAQNLGKLGAKLVLTARSREVLDNLQKELAKEKNAQESLVLVCDVGLLKEEEANKMAEQIIKKFGRIDFLFNNAGMSCRASVLEANMDLYQKLMAVNFFGSVMLVKAVLPYWQKQKSGHVIVTSSISGKVGTPFRSAYTASKHALHGFFDSLRAENSKDNINVTIICLGYVRTKLSFNALLADCQIHNAMDENQKKGLLPEIAAKKILKAVVAKKAEVYIGGKEVFAVYLKRFLPSMLNWVLQKMEKK